MAQAQGMLISRDEDNSQQSWAEMRILPWGFAERTSLKFFQRANFFPLWKLKRTGEGWGKGEKLFSFFITFFFYLLEYHVQIQNFFLLLSHTCFLGSKLQEIQNKEKHSLSLFTAFHLPKDVSHLQETSKVSFSVNCIFSFKICFAKVAAFCERKSSVTKVFFCSKTFNQL